MNELLDLLSESSTRFCLNAPSPPPIPKGKQKFRFEVGQTYFASPHAKLKAGTPIKIIDRYEQHGYCYYVGEGMTHREVDLTETPA